MKSLLYRFVCCLWAALLATLFLTLAARALAPAALFWSVQPGGEGQLTIYNDVPRGGHYGLPVELGDFDGDGCLDPVLAPMGAPSGPIRSREMAGEVYIYPGDCRISGVLDRARPEGRSRGLTLWGARPGDMLGTELFTSDVDGDGIEDLLVSAQNHDHDAVAGDVECCTGCRENCGAVYVVLGREDLLASERTIDLSLPPDELHAEGITTIVGAEPGERLGVWVEAGDLDGDGVRDILIGADQFPALGVAPGGCANDPEGHKGKAYVIYGRESYPALIDLTSFTDGVTVIHGKDRGDHFGGCLHANDLDADGDDELIVGAAINRLSASLGGCTEFCAHPTGGGDGPDDDRPNAGEVYVFFGDADRLPPLIDLATEANALEEAGALTTIHGAGEGDTAGEEITSGDFNGDGLPDLVIGALAADGTGGELQAGRAYILYWAPGLEGTTIDLAAPPGDRPAGLVISEMYGLTDGGILGDTLAAADFNHDGKDDLAVGVPHAEANGEVRAGIVAVVLGRDEHLPPFWAPEADELPPQLEVAYVLGGLARDLMSYSMEARDYDADGFADLYPNAMRGDGAGDEFESAGEAYVISGFHLSASSLGLQSVEPPVGHHDESTAVVLTGSGFTTNDDTSVLLGEVPVTEVDVLSATEIAALFPPGALGSAVSVAVVNRYGTASLPVGFRYADLSGFIRGDANLDGRINLTDAVYNVGVLFVGRPLVCADAMDADDDGQLRLTDAIYLLSALFRDGAFPPPPFPEPGVDPTDDDLEECLR